MTKPSKPSTPKRRGFTLVELLVVITIVIVLAALTFTIVRKARNMALNANCVTSLRQLGAAGLSFASEKGAYPSHGRQLDGSNEFWFKAMEMELGFEAGTSAAVIERSEAMPTCERCLNTHGPGTNPNNRHIRTYSMSHGILKATMNSEGQMAFPSLSTSRVVNASSSAFFMDGRLVGQQPYWDYLVRRNEWLRPENFIHDGKANVVFLDGHVESLRLGEIPTNPQHPFWNPESTVRNP